MGLLRNMLSRRSNLLEKMQIHALEFSLTVPVQSQAVFSQGCVSPGAREKVKCGIPSNRGKAEAVLAWGLCKGLSCLEVPDGNQGRKLNRTGCFHLGRLL